MQKSMKGPQITEYLYAKATVQRIPFSGAFELTPVCNMSCRMCYVRMTAQQQESIRPLHTAEEWIALGKRAKEQGMLYLLLTGGEPFLHPEMRAIMEGLHELGLLISINSNATMINEKTVEWLKHCPPIRVNVTLYGASDETYGRLCNNPKGFTQAMRGIQLLREAGITVKINCSLTPYNVCDLEKIMSFCKENDLVIAPVTYMFPPLRRDGSMVGRNDRFTPEEAAYYSAKIERIRLGDEGFLEKHRNGDYSPMPTDPDDYCNDAEGGGMRCRAGKCSFWVNWDGSFHACGMIPDENCPNAFELNFSEAWAACRKRAEAIRLPAICDSCPAAEQCHNCAACTITETGDFSKRPEYKCRMVAAFPEAYAKVCEEIGEERRNRAE